MKAWKVKVQVKPWPEGGYIAKAPALQGCWVVAPSVAEAIRDIYEVIEMSIVSRTERGEPLSKDLKPVEMGDHKTIQVQMAVAVS